MSKEKSQPQAQAQKINFTQDEDDYDEDKTPQAPILSRIGNSSLTSFSFPLSLSSSYSSSSSPPAAAATPISPMASHTHIRLVSSVPLLILFFLKTSLSSFLLQLPPICNLPSSLYLFAVLFSPLTTHLPCLSFGLSVFLRPTRANLPQKLSWTGRKPTPSRPPYPLHHLHLHPHPHHQSPTPTISTLMLAWMWMGAWMMIMISLRQPRPFRRTATRERTPLPPSLHLSSIRKRSLPPLLQLQDLQEGWLFYLHLPLQTRRKTPSLNLLRLHKRLCRHCLQGRSPKVVIPPLLFHQQLHPVRLLLRPVNNRSSNPLPKLVPPRNRPWNHPHLHPHLHRNHQGKLVLLCQRRVLAREKPLFPKENQGSRRPNQDPLHRLRP